MHKVNLAYLTAEISANSHNL